MEEKLHHVLSIYNLILVYLTGFSFLFPSLFPSLSPLFLPPSLPFIHSDILLLTRILPTTHSMTNLTSE